MAVKKINVLSWWHSRKIVRNAKILCSQAKKVINYRRHLLTIEIVTDIRSFLEILQQAISKKNIPEIIQSSQKLEKILTQYGGNIFPIKFWSDNAEVLFVSVLLAVSLRTFFVQSFQIPTNSMYPTYSGMRHVINHNADATGVRSLSYRLLHGVRTVRSFAKTSGNITIPLQCGIRSTTNETCYFMPYNVIVRRTLGGLYKQKKRQYTLYAGGVRHTFETPIDFSADDAVREYFFGKTESWGDVINKNNVKSLKTSYGLLLSTNRLVTAGDGILIFEILAGDMLFVDKISPHFRSPKVGESVVFTSDDIHAMEGSPKFLIKRVVGADGDNISCKNNILFRNGKEFPINSIIGEISHQNGEYSKGYQAHGMLSNGNIVTVPNDNYFMLGDNSCNSYDSRFWGFAPKRSIRGFPLLIFYPMSDRVGPCK